MEKKGTIVSIIFVITIVICISALIIFSGITANEYNYVQLEVNPKVEFLCDNRFKVVSYRPLNNEAKIILSDVDYIGMSMEDASVDFLDLCAKTGYIDVDGKDNAVNITVIDGLTQALDVHIVKNINTYLRKKEILCAVTETYEDRNMIDKKKENNVCCANKLKLIETIMDYDDNAKLDTLKKLSEVELIDLVSNIHNTSNYKSLKEEKKQKEILINNNKEKYDNHINSINNNSQKEFNKLYEDYQKSTEEKYKTNFEEKYILWQNKHSIWQYIALYKQKTSI